MRETKKRCLYCRRWFQPHPRTAAFQKACSDPACRRERKASADKAWRVRHPGYDAHRRLKVRAWAQAFPDYWRTYRAAHPAYVERDNRRRGRARERASRAAKQDAIRNMAVGRLRDIQRIVPETAAKQDAIFRRTEGVLDFLLWKERAAKHDDIAFPAPAA